MEWLLLAGVAFVLARRFFGGRSMDGTRSRLSDPPPPPRDSPTRTSYTLKPLDGDNGSGYVVVRKQDRQHLGWRTLPASEGIRAFNVVGEQYRLKQIQGHRFNPAERVRLVPEPENEHDADAVAVWSWDGRAMAGYVPRDEARTYKQIASSGDPYDAIVMWETSEGRRRVQLRVLVAESGAAIDLST